MAAVATLYRSTIGKKVVMALSGMILVGFVVFHMIGNLKIYLGPVALNTYAAFLREVGEPLLPYEVLLWMARLVLLAAVGAHIVAAVQLTRKDRDGRPVHYANKRTLQASFASKTMRWGGVIVLLFIIFHLLNFTFGAVGYDAARPYVHGENGEFQAYNNVVYGFMNPFVSLFYILAMGALGLHLYHGTWSMFQTLGVNSYRWNAMWRWLAIGVAIVTVLGNISIPIAVMLGFLQPVAG
ncbi:MAG: succinate dehydrogenase cytochrome b subunit [Roseiflexaceae bacterium]|nr:succinate dehydrogenase cytochrome b subunit [Roseiflexaceae bacterium]